jgi:hypothetical protein
MTEQSNAPSFLSPHHAISPLVRLAATPAVSDAVWADVYLLTLSRLPRPRNSADRIGQQFAAATRRAASDPTSTTSVSPSNRSVSSGAFATLLLLKQRLACCIHQLNPPSTPGVWLSESVSVLVRCETILSDCRTGAQRGRNLRICS